MAKSWSAASFSVQTASRAAQRSPSRADVNPIANNVVYAIALQSDGMILVGGLFNGLNSIGGQTSYPRLAQPAADVQSEPEWLCICNRRAIGRQGFGERQL
ncbi:MAG: hypothetical protein IPI64_04725 [Chloracidobacterium sp.]|nr:hypothetical protein [Chloracidobacterium sp.]